MAAPAPRRVAVLGAGPAGLAAAHWLAGRGVPVDVLELRGEVGGLCVTIERNGFRFDLGGHRWFTKNAELHRWFLELMRGELVSVDRVSRIYFEGKYFDYPISIRNVLENAGLARSALAFLSYLRAAVTDVVARREPANMKEAFCAQFGERLFDMFFRRYSEKVWGCPCEEISADWVDQRSKGLSILVALRDALTKSRDVVSLIDRFVYPRLGYQRICQRMAEDIAGAGGRVHLNSPVAGITWRGPNDLLVHHGPDPVQSLAASDVISTLPLTHLVRMFTPEAPAAVLAAARSLSYRDLITVTVMLRKPRVTADTWLYVHDEHVLFARLHEPKNWSPAMVPSADVTSLVCECFCSFDDAIWRMSDLDLVARVVSDLADRLGFIRRDEVLDSCVVRTRFAYPVYDLAYRDRLAVLYDFLNQHAGVHIVGRGGTFRYNNADHSIEMGQLLAKRLLGEAHDHMSVNTERAYHEEIRRTLAGTIPGDAPETGPRVASTRK